MKRLSNDVFSRNERNDPSLANERADRVEPAIIKSNSDIPNLAAPITRTWLRMDKIDAKDT